MILLFYRTVYLKHIFQLGNEEVYLSEPQPFVHKKELNRRGKKYNNFILN